jgi:peptidase E
MKMFLSSTIDVTINLLLKKTRKRRVLFINNPVDLFKNKYWMRKEKMAFLDRGYELYECDIRKESASIIKKFDIVHICGGSALYILDLLKKTGWYNVILYAIKKDHIIYTGTSAGSMIMAPNISFSADDEDEQECGMVGKVKNMDSFGLIPFYLMCHAQEKYYIPSTKKAIDRLPKNKLSILFLNDNMALWVEDKKIELLQN